jgi:hypothetical protein
MDPLLVVLSSKGFLHWITMSKYIKLVEISKNLPKIVIFFSFTLLEIISL